MTDAGSGSERVIRVGMVDDHRSPIWGIERVLDTVDDISLVCSASTVAGVLAGMPLDVVLLDLRLDDGTTPRENVNALADAGVATVVYTSGEHPALLRSAARAGALGVVLKSADESVIIDAIRAAAEGRAVLTTEWAAAIDGDPELAAVDLSPQLQKVWPCTRRARPRHGSAPLWGCRPRRSTSISSGFGRSTPTPDGPPGQRWTCSSGRSRTGGFRSPSGTGSASQGIGRTDLGGLGRRSTVDGRREGAESVMGRTRA